MKFQTAKDRLKKLAKGKYHSVRYELTEDSPGESRTECRIYIGDETSGKSGIGKTFQEAFDKLKKLEEIPDIEG